MFGKKKDGHPGGATPAGGAALDPELQALMDLEEAERNATTPAGPPGAALDPDLQALMDQEEAERSATTPAGTVLDPELQALMDLEEAERRGDSDPF
jgi:hypothetical protein